jgi:hypothetical protein
MPKLLLGVQEFPNHAPLNRHFAACYAHMGRLDEARGVIARLRAINPVGEHQYSMSRIGPRIKSFLG